MAVSGAQPVREAFHDHLTQILGTCIDTLNFEPEMLYPMESVDLMPLQATFIEHEVYTAIRQLPSNKSVGPDGLPHEFVKSYWPILKKDIMPIF